ncbi:hypothetical protein BH23PLA1_BH23PLA1_04960 [soil metagenome]
MPELAKIRKELLDQFPETWVDQHLKSFQGRYFQTFDPEDLACQLRMITELADDRRVIVKARPIGSGPPEWRVAIAGYDAFQFLSTVCRLLAIHGLWIVAGRIFTSEPPPEPSSTASKAVRRMGPRSVTRPTMRRKPLRGPDRRRKIIDVFRVRSMDQADAPPDWDQFQAELSALLELLLEGQHDEVHHRLTRRFVNAMERHRPPSESLEPIDLKIDPEGSDYATVVQVQARDSFGFLSLMTSALALCGIRIVQADIRTGDGDGRVNDTLWVTDRSGRKISTDRELRELHLSLILIEHFSSKLPHASDPEAALLHFSRFATDTMARPDFAEEFAALDRPEVLDALVRVLGESEFLWEDYLHAQPENVLPLINDPAAWQTRRGPEALEAELEAAIAAASSKGSKARALQRFKDREIFRADIRSILGLTTPDRFASELTDVAEVLVRRALPLAAEVLGLDPPHHADGTPAPLALCALGKFGGRELGFASDLELLLVYDDRDIVEAPDSLTAGDYFDRLVSSLRTVLGGRRGGTFELDLRLRPYGRNGPPATSLTTFKNYYQSGGPAWSYERQALVKLRAVAGDLQLGRALHDHRDRFVFGPEPFDLENFRKMRELQIKQLVRPGTINAKFSPGALVDVEYFIQALQIAYGRDDRTVRTPNTLEALEALEAARRLDRRALKTLRAGYHFCRALIGALRVVLGNAQDLTIPEFDSEEFLTLSRRMRIRNPSDLQAQIETRLHDTQALTDLLAGYLPEGSQAP